MLTQRSKIQPGRRGDRGERRGAKNLLAGYTVILLSAFPVLAVAQIAATAPARTAGGVDEHVFRTDLLAFPKQWAFQLGRSMAIVVSDEQLRQLANPDQKVNLSLGPTPQEQSLRELCEQAKAAGQRTLIIAFDHFFAQYRPGQGDTPRQLTPDKPEYIRLIAAISQFAQQYGIGLELSLLSPLEVGPAYAAETGEHGVWMQYRKGLREPKSGAYSVQLWRQTQWANNKGAIRIEDAGVRVFAFREQRIRGTPYLFVDPKSIVDISSTAQVEAWPESRQPTAYRVRIHGKGEANAAGLDRVLVVQMYKTPEMDYFSERAPAYLRQLIDRYVDAGVKLNGLYSDEMHIQQDWSYDSHHEHGQFAMRYVSPGLARQFAARYGKQYEDFARWLIYFCYGQDDFAADLSANDRLMHVWGQSPTEIQATALFRSRYYKLLQDGVVDLFTGVKKYAEGRFGHALEARAHATWAESPTCDVWHPGQNKYEYTSGFVWSNTVQQAAAACHDYFKWGDFLTGNGNDHAEGGWLDRNYYALALAASTGILNDVPNAYAAIWGAPDEIIRRRNTLNNASGASAFTPYALVQDGEHRDVQVLMLYPIDLVAAEERFGSWMSQYGYANYITQSKLLERGKVVNGAIEMAGRRFTTLVAEFEPFPSRRLMEMMRQLADGGGRVIWSGPPPVLADDGTSVMEAWRALFGVTCQPTNQQGLGVPGQQVRFEGDLGSVPPMTILTDFLVDRVYPLTPAEGTTVLARVKDRIVGTSRKLPSGGRLVVLGFRPRDDQSASLGYEERHWFDILNALGAYPPTGRLAGVNDNTEYLSRTTGYLTCRFPNGAVAVAPHLHDLDENWPGGFARNREQDEAVLKNLKLPSEQIELDGFKINGHTVTYKGQQALTFRADDHGVPIAFCGAGCNQITIDGRTTVFAKQPMPFAAWAPLSADRRVPNGAIMQVLVHGTGEVQIPVPGVNGPVEMFAQGATLGSRGAAVLCRLENGVLIFNTPNTWVFVVPRTSASTSATAPS